MAQLHPDPSGGQLAQSYTPFATTISTSGDNTVVAAPGAGNRFVIKDLVIQNESATTTTVLVKSGSTTCWRAVLAERQALTLSFETLQEWRLGTNEALVINLSGANSHGVSGRRWTEAV